MTLSNRIMHAKSHLTSNQEKSMGNYEEFSSSDLSNRNRMVTANLNHEQQPPSIMDSDDDADHRQMQTRLVSISYFSRSTFILISI